MSIPGTVVIFQAAAEGSRLIKVLGKKNQHCNYFLKLLVFLKFPILIDVNAQKRSDIRNHHRISLPGEGFGVGSGDVFRVQDGISMERCALLLGTAPRHSLGRKNSSSGFYSFRHFYGRTNILESSFKINIMNSASRTGMMVNGRR